MSDNKDKCMRVDCAAHIEDRKLKTNKCCKLYDDIVVQQTPHHVGPACLFFTTTPTTSVPVAELEALQAESSSDVTHHVEEIVKRLVKMHPPERQHFCPEWDGMEINEFDPEFNCCLCYKEIK